MREPRNVDLRIIGVDSPSPDGTCDVIFVHGLDGDPVKTWQHDPKHPDVSFPRLLAGDLSSVRVWALGYPAQEFGGKCARAMSIEDRAKSVLEGLAAEGFGPRRIVFIAHSLGGLLVKQMLRFAAETTADPRWRRIGEAVLGVVFLATPHTGSDLANVADALRRALGPSVATLDLERYSAKLLDLREWYSEFSVSKAIETLAFAETRPSKVHGISIGIVVPKESAWPGGAAKTIAIENVDHFQIAQPPTREATVYKDVLSNLQLWLAKNNARSHVSLERETHQSEAHEKPFAVFLSHSHIDASAVEEIARVLEDRKKLRVWLDKWILVPGNQWQQEMARGLDDASSCAVFIGGKTPDGWCHQEIQRALNRQSKDPSFRVIPVLLPNADSSYVQDFLELRTWIDFTKGTQDEHALHRLVCGIRGIPPGRGPESNDDQVDLDPKGMVALHKLKQLSRAGLIREELLIEAERKILDRLIGY